MNRIMMFKETYIVGIYDRFTLREEWKIGHNLDASSLKHLKKKKHTNCVGCLEAYPKKG